MFLLTPRTISVRLRPELPVHIKLTFFTVTIYPLLSWATDIWEKLEVEVQKPEGIAFGEVPDRFHPWVSHSILIAILMDSSHNDSYSYGIMILILMAVKKAATQIFKQSGIAKRERPHLYDSRVRTDPTALLCRVKTGLLIYNLSWFCFLFVKSGQWQTWK